MKKIFCALLSAALLALALAGCGGAASTKTYNLTDVMTAIEQANPVENPRDIDDTAMQYEMLLTMDNVEEYVGQVSNTQGNSATVLVIKAVAGKADAVKTELETYRTNQVAMYGNYPEFAEGMALIQDGRIVTKGDYVVLVFAGAGADYTAIDTAVDSALS